MNLNESHIRTTKSKTLNALMGAFLLIIATSLPLEARISIETEWTLIQETEGVRFYYRLENCSEQTMLSLRISNNSSTVIAGNWILDIDNGQESIQFLGSIMPLNVDEEVMATCTNLESNLLFPTAIYDPSSVKVVINATIDTLQ